MAEAKTGQTPAGSPQDAKLTQVAAPAGFRIGAVPLKVVTGTQTTTAVNFELKPGAVLAHAGSTVIFVCG